MVTAAAAFPSRPFNLRSEVYLVSQDTNPSAPRSLVGWQLWIDKTGYSPTFSANRANRTFYLDGAQVGIAIENGFDFRPNGPWLILSGQNWVAHNPDGTKTVSASGNADYDILGAAQVNSALVLPTIPTYGPPNPPKDGAITNITKTSFTYSFWYNGGVVQSYQVRYATKPDYSDAVIISGGGGTVQLTGLKSGTEYFVQARALNDRGASDWGADASARTRSGAWISDGTKWIPADVLISDGTKWIPADVLISDGAQWKPTG